MRLDETLDLVTKANAVLADTQKAREHAADPRVQDTIRVMEKVGVGKVMADVARFRRAGFAPIFTARLNKAQGRSRARRPGIARARGSRRGRSSTCLQRAGPDDDPGPLSPSPDRRGHHGHHHHVADLVLAAGDAS